MHLGSYQKVTHSEGGSFPISQSSYEESDCWVTHVQCIKKAIRSSGNEVTDGCEPPTVLALGHEPRFSVWAVSTLDHWTIFTSPFFFSDFGKNVSRILMMRLDSLDILKILVFPTYDHGKSFHFLTFLTTILSLKRYFRFSVKFITRYFSYSYSE